MVYQDVTKTVFTIHTAHDPQALARVLDVFNVQGLEFKELSARHVSKGVQHITLTLESVKPFDKSVVVRKLNSMFTVTHAEAVVIPLQPEAQQSFVAA